ncbi:hypothetical protein FDP41_010358 [Naegleria fowleri]|uniref:Xrn1 N-terminal domain-containing protein n=1 Tax=Naegleria fowleri TaxID=5763 RepID=A0A6A5BYS7_NAEFO|nr:uncharacterized protein FDP41_010358 [Naegleria fowleri]KAF0983293.1 hypothetical protein FDP41_010358 [Naegleria fowleri]
MGVPSFMSQLNSIINSLYQQEHIGLRYQKIISNVMNERKNKNTTTRNTSNTTTTTNTTSNNSQQNNSSCKFQPPFISNRIHSKVFDCIYIDINPIIHGVVRGVQNSLDATAEKSQTQDSKKKDSKKKKSNDMSSNAQWDDKIVRGVIKSLEEVMTSFKANSHWFISFDGVATKSKRIKQRSHRAKESKKRNGEEKKTSGDKSHANETMNDNSNTQGEDDGSSLDPIMDDEEMIDDDDDDSMSVTTSSALEDSFTNSTTNLNSLSNTIFETPKKRSLSVEISPGTNLSKKIYQGVLNLSYHYSKTHNVTVYVSSSSRSGEGETKIIEHLRTYMMKKNKSGHTRKKTSREGTSLPLASSVLIISHDSDMVLIPLSNPELNCSFYVLVPNGTRCTYGTMIDITGLKLLLYHLFKMNHSSSIIAQNTTTTIHTTSNSSNSSVTPSDTLTSPTTTSHNSTNDSHSSILNNSSSTTSTNSSTTTPSNHTLPNSNEIIQQLCIDFVCISLLAGGCDYFNPFAKTLEHRWRRYFKLIQTEKTNYSIFTLKHNELTNEYILTINTNNLLFVFGSYVRDKRNTLDKANPDRAIQFFKQLTACLLQFKGQLPIMEYFSRKLSMIDLLALIEKITTATTETTENGTTPETATTENGTTPETTTFMKDDLNTTTITTNTTTNTTPKKNKKKSSNHPNLVITISFQELVDTYHLTPLEGLFSMITSHNSHALPHDKLIELFSFSPKLCDLLHIDSKFNYESSGNDNHWIASNEPYDLIRKGIMEWKERYPTITDEDINNKHIGTIQFTCLSNGTSGSNGSNGGAVLKYSYHGQNHRSNNSINSTSGSNVSSSSSSGSSSSGSSGSSSNVSSSGGGSASAAVGTKNVSTTKSSKASNHASSSNSSNNSSNNNNTTTDDSNSAIVVEVLEETIRPYEACVPYPFVPGIYTTSRLRLAEKIKYQRANSLNQHTLGEEFDRIVLTDIPSTKTTTKQVKIVKKKQLPPKKKKLQKPISTTSLCQSVHVTENDVNRSGILQALLQKSDQLPEVITVNMDTSDNVSSQPSGTMVLPQKDDNKKKRKLNQLSYSGSANKQERKAVKREESSMNNNFTQVATRTTSEKKKRRHPKKKTNNNADTNTSSEGAQFDGDDMKQE